jgi:hypothetical protein
MPDRNLNAPCGAPDIEDFLAGRTGGDGLLHALYDHVLLEPVPPRIVDLVRRHRWLASLARASPKK